jgi:hypothetical protein
MAERAWQDELQQFLDARFLALCSMLNQAIPGASLRIGPPLALNEAKYFILGLEAGLFGIDAEGYVESSLVPQLNIGNAKPEMCRIFLHDPPPPRLAREAICRFSTAAALILDRGWLERQIQIKATIEAESTPAYGVDLVVKSLAGKLLAGVEVKRSGHELAKLKNDFYQCCKRGKHPEGNCGFPRNHGKFEFCAFHKPTYFWAVAPDGEICFKMNYREDGTIQPDEIASLPPRSIVELGTKS